MTRYLSTVSMREVNTAVTWPIVNTMPMYVQVEVSVSITTRGLTFESLNMLYLAIITL